MTLYPPGIATETIVNHVDRWPGQENKIWEQKVPSVMLYSGQGEASDKWHQ